MQMMGCCELINSLGPIGDISVMVSYGILYGGFNTRRYTLVHGFFIKLFIVGPKGLRVCEVGYI